MKSGRFEIVEFESDLLQANPLGDPHVRDIPVYLPPDYDTSDREYPVIYLLTGYSGRGIFALNQEPFTESLEDRLNRLISEKRMEPAVVVLPDCFTYYGGSQYLNSDASGPYEAHIVDELVPYVCRKFGVNSDPKKQAVMGKSSGGYGAIVLSLRNPDIFGIAASHSGDMAFEYCYLPDFPPAMLELERFSGVPEFVRDFYAQPKKKPASFLTMNVLAMASCYSPNPETKPHNFDLPFDTSTGELIESVWQRWLAWDPVRMIDQFGENARKVQFFIDCGTQDEHRLYAGARMFSAKLREIGVDHIYEEFVDNHRGLNYRYDRSLEQISKYFRGG